MQAGNFRAAEPLYAEALLETGGRFPWVYRGLGLAYTGKTGRTWRNGAWIGFGKKPGPREPNG